VHGPEEAGHSSWPAWPKLQAPLGPMPSGHSFRSSGPVSGIRAESSRCQSSMNTPQRAAVPPTSSRARTGHAAPRAAALSREPGGAWNNLKRHLPTSELPDRRRERCLACVTTDGCGDNGQRSRLHASDAGGRAGACGRRWRGKALHCRGSRIHGLYKSTSIDG